MPGIGRRVSPPEWLLLAPGGNTCYKTVSLKFASCRRPELLSPKLNETFSNFLVELLKRASGPGLRIVFPEGTNPEVIAAASLAVAHGVGRPILLGPPDSIETLARERSASLDGVTLAGALDDDRLEHYSRLYSERRGTKLLVARQLLQKSGLFQGAMMAAGGDADALVAGIDSPTSRVIEAARLCLGLAPGVTTASSFYVMVLPGQASGGERVFIHADAAVNPNPTAEELAQIAVLAGRGARGVLAEEPRIALLSFSTHGSARHSDVDKVAAATRRAQELAPDLLIDGELQFDAAVEPRVGTKKAPQSPVAGRANVLIFPDLDAGNIGYKMTQYLAGAKAYGPILQGFARPVSDLSRGAVAEDILAVSAIVALEAKESAE